MSALRHLLSAKAALLAGGGMATAVLVGPSVALADKDDSKSSSKKSDDRFFDPTALERGAKALREINQSPYAKQVRAGWLVRACTAMHGRVLLFLCTRRRACVVGAGIQQPAGSLWKLAARGMVPAQGLAA